MSASCLLSARAFWFPLSPLSPCRTQLTLHARNSFAATDTLSAWIVSFMVSKRSSPAAATRYVLAGVWAGDVAYTSQRPLEFSAGDLDEGMSALLRNPDGSDAITFDRVAAFENGFFEGDRGTLDSVELCGG